MGYARNEAVFEGLAHWKVIIGGHWSRWRCIDDRENQPAQQQRLGGRSDGVCVRHEQTQRSVSAYEKALGVTRLKGWRSAAKRLNWETTPLQIHRQRGQVP